MRILITGGFGFVGGRLAQHLQQVGHQVVLGTRKTICRSTWLPQAEILTANWNDARALEQICHGVDVVIQAAGMNAQDCAANPVAALEFNGLATARLVSAAARAGVKRFIYLSTAHVYASPLGGIINEDTCPRNLHPYATSHLAGENAVLCANQRGEIEGLVLRLSNAFGAPVDKNVNCWMLLVNDLCRQAVELKKIVLYSSGLQLRDFITLTEVCRIIGHLLFRPSNTIPSILNVGSGLSKTVLEMGKLIQKRCQIVLGYTPEIQQPQIETPIISEILSYQSKHSIMKDDATPLDSDIEIDHLLKFCQMSYR